MKLSLILLPALLLGLTSCDKVKEAAAFFEEALGDEQDAATAYEGDRIKALGADDYDAFTEIRGRVVIVDFYADWCPPCRQIAPVLDGLVAEHDGLVLLGKVDVDKHQELAHEHGVRGIPDIRIFKNGKQVDKFGPMPAFEVRRRVEAQLEGLSLPKSESPPKSGDAPKSGTTPAAAGEGTSDESAPKIQPMTKDWLPPGVERRQP